MEAIQVPLTMIRSQEEKRARDKPLNIDLASSSGDKSLQHLEMTDDLGTKVDIILPSLEVVNSKHEIT